MGHGSVKPHCIKLKRTCLHKDVSADGFSFFTTITRDGRENLHSPVSDRFLYKSTKVTFDFQKFPDYNKVSFEDIVRFFVIGDSRNEYTET